MALGFAASVKLGMSVYCDWENIYGINCCSTDDGVTRLGRHYGFRWDMHVREIMQRRDSSRS